MTEEQIKQKAENVYMRCFDDDFKYKGVLHALEICARETATEAAKELQEKNDLQWHYLKNGDYPLLETDVLICIKLLNNDKVVKIGSFQQGGGILIEGFICSVNAAVAWQALRELPTED